MKKNILKYLILALLFPSCSQRIRETILDAQTGEKIGGYTNEGISLNKGLNKTDIPQGKIVQLRSKGLGLLFSDNESGMLRAISMHKESGEIFSTQKGLKTGDSIDDAIMLYGKRFRRKKIYWLIGDTPRYYVDALNYKGLTVYYDADSRKIVAILIGNRK